MPLPPTEEIVSALKQSVAPAAAGAAGVAGLGGALAWLLGKPLKLSWQPLAPYLAVLALAGAWWFGNQGRGAFPAEWPPVKPWHAAFWAAFVAFAVDFVGRSPKCPRGADRLLRGVAAGVVGSFVMSDGVRQQAPWLLPAFALLTATIWATVDAAARAQPGAVTPAAMAVACGAAAAVLIESQNAGFADAATFLFTGLVVTAVLAYATDTDAGSAASAAVLPLLTLLLLGKLLRDSDVPTWSFLAVAASPLMLAAFLAPGLDKLPARPGPALLKLGAVAAPAAWGVWRAVQAGGSAKKKTK